MKLLKYPLIVLLLCSLFGSLQAQAQQQSQTSSETQSIDEGSIDDQFEYVIRKSSNWSDENGRTFEVIRRNMILTLKAHTLDSLNAVHGRLENANSQVSTQQNEIEALKTTLNKTEEELVETNLEKDSMVFLGAQMSKTSYNVLLWAIIAALLALLLFFIFRFKNSNYVTKETKNALAEMEQEFQEHRRNALEREQKIKRQLQDEINKHKA